jgi:hypothetical protein
VSGKLNDLQVYARGKSCGVRSISGWVEEWAELDMVVESSPPRTKLGHVAGSLQVQWRNLNEHKF